MKIKGLLLIFLTLLGLSDIYGAKYPWELSFNALEKKANKKNPTKEEIWYSYWMGRTFEEGRLSQIPDIRKAFDWYLISAKLNNPAAQYRIAQMYRDGEGTQKDEVNYLHWLKECADNSLDNRNVYGWNHCYESDIAKIEMARLLGQGVNGITPNPDKAIEDLEGLEINYAYTDYTKIPEKEYDFIFLGGMGNSETEALRNQALGELYLKKAINNSRPDSSFYSKSSRYYEKEENFLKDIYRRREYNYHLLNIRQLEKDISTALKNAVMTRYFGQKATMDNDTTELMRLTRLWIKDGSSKAAVVFLGKLYYYGLAGIQQDKEKGRTIMRGARYVSPEVAYITGRDYYDKKNYKVALDYFTELERMYNQGVYVEPSAMSDAYRKMSIMYRLGRDLFADKTKSDEYHAKSTEFEEPDYEKIEEWLIGDM